MARLGIAAYRGPRVLINNGIALTPLYPGSGAVPGCGLACTFAKVVTIDLLDYLVAAHTAVNFSLYVDDLQVGAVAEERDVADLVADAFADAVATFRAERSLDFGAAKTAVAASANHISRYLRRRVLRAGGVPAKAIVALGIDYGAGRRRR